MWQNFVAYPQFMTWMMFWSLQNNSKMFVTYISNQKSVSPDTKKRINFFLPKLRFGPGPDFCSPGPGPGPNGPNPDLARARARADEKP